MPADSTSSTRLELLIAVPSLLVDRDAGPRRRAAGDSTSHDTSPAVARSPAATVRTGTPASAASRWTSAHASGR